MGRIGTNISYGGGIPITGLQSLGISAVRVVAHKPEDDTAYFEQLRQAGIRIWLTMASESFAGFDNWPDAFDEYRRRYFSLVDWWEAGNEPDIVSDSSWTLAPGTYERLLLTARDRLGPDAKISAGGLASGLPGWLAGDEPEWVNRFRSHELKVTSALAHYDWNEHNKPVNLDWVNGIAIHPYGQSPGLPFPESQGGPFGRVDHKVREYRDWLDAHRPDKSLHITEWGAPVKDFEPRPPSPPDTVEAPEDFGDYIRRIKAQPAAQASAPDEIGGGPLGSPEARAGQAEYIGNMVRTLVRLDAVGDAIQFCYSDRMVEQFGLTDRDFNGLAAQDAFLLALSQTPVNV
ncbi:MAG: hypothetical protein U0893_00715 [Chloroflexota bacterium]